MPGPPPGPPTGPPPGSPSGPPTVPPVGSVHLDAGRADRDGAHGLHFEAPVAVETLAAGDDPADLYARLQAHLDAGRWVAGYLAYEAAHARHGLPLPTGGPPLAWFGAYDRPARERRSAGPVDGAPPPRPASGVTPGRFTPDPATWRRRIAAVQAALRAGETYQVNLTGRRAFDAPHGGFAAYRAWLAAHPVPFAAYLRPDADREIVSLSPELFLRSDGDAVWTRPMKGTAPRLADPHRDARQADALVADAKTRAEHVMIVDLLRNDLGRVAEAGGVDVPALFEVERYATVWQVTSTVRARLPAALRGRALGPALEAAFPCGSVTGAPKRATMALLHDLEDGPRGAYCGAIGYAAPDGRFVFNVAIRTAEVAGGRGVLGLGGGVVVDSDADAEYDEALLKGRFMESA